MSNTNETDLDAVFVRRADARRRVDIIRKSETQKKKRKTKQIVDETAHKNNNNIAKATFRRDLRSISLSLVASSP